MHEKAIKDLKETLEKEEQNASELKSSIENLRQELVTKETNHNEALDKLEVLLQQETEDCEKAKTSLKDLMTKLETLKPDADQKPILEEEISNLKDELKKTSDKVKELTNNNEAQSGKIRLLLSNYQKLSKVKDETDGQVNDLIKEKEKLQKEFKDYKENAENELDKAIANSEPSNETLPWETDAELKGKTFPKV